MYNILYATPLFIHVGRNSSLDTATRYGLDGTGIESRKGARFSATVQAGPGALATGAWRSPPTPT